MKKKNLLALNAEDKH